MSPEELTGTLARLKRQDEILAEGHALTHMLAQQASLDAADALTIFRSHTEMINGWGEQLSARIDRLSAEVRVLSTGQKRFEREVRDSFAVVSANIAASQDAIMKRIEQLANDGKI